MQAILWKFFSTFMAFLFSVSGYLPGFISEKLVNPPVEDIEIFENGDSDGLLKVANSRVFFSYSEWEAFCGSLDEREKDFCDGKVSEEIFDEHNLAVVDITMPGSEPAIYINSAEEKVDTLTLNYVLVSELGMDGTDEVYEQTVLAVVSKFVSKAEAIKGESVTIPEMKPGLAEKTHNGLYDINQAVVFDSYTNWVDFKETSDIDPNGFNDIYDEYFFVKYNLGIVAITYGDSRTSCQYVGSYVEDGVLKVEYYDRQVYPDYVAVPCEPSTETLFFITRKNVSSIEMVCLGEIDYHEPETGVVGIYTVDSFYDEENSCTAFSDYESWNYYRERNYFVFGDSDFETAIAEDFFLGNNLVAATVVMPNGGGYDVHVNSVTEEFDTAKIEWSKIVHKGVYPGVVEYKVILYASDKFVEKATCTEVEYPYYQEGIVATVDATGGDEEDILLFKDDESWQNFKNTTSWQFTGYEEIVNENYFDNNNLMIAFIELPSSQHEIEWVEDVAGCGVLNFRLTQPEGETDGETRYKAVICVTCKRVEEPVLIESTP